MLYVLHSVITLKGVGIIAIYQMGNVKPRRVKTNKKMLPTVTQRRDSVLAVCDSRPGL